jgi:hypothetical protein
MTDSSLLPALIVALEKVNSDLIGVSVTWIPGGDDLQKEVKELATSYASLRQILAQGAAEDVIHPPGQEAIQFLTDLLCNLENAVEASKSAEDFLPTETKVGWKQREDKERAFWFDNWPEVCVDRLMGLKSLADTVRDVAKRLQNQHLIEDGNRGRTIVRAWEKDLSELMIPSPPAPTTPRVPDQATVNACSTLPTAKTEQGKSPPLPDYWEKWNKWGRSKPLLVAFYLVLFLLGLVATYFMLLKNVLK